MSAVLNTIVNGTQFPLQFESFSWKRWKDARLLSSTCFCTSRKFSHRNNRSIRQTQWESFFLLLYREHGYVRHAVFNFRISTDFNGVVFWLMTDHWCYWSVLCKFVPFASDVSVTISMQSQVLMAVDRFGAVVHPLHNPLISSQLCILILATWITARAANQP